MARCHGEVADLFYIPCGRAQTGPARLLASQSTLQVVFYSDLNNVTICFPGDYYTQIVVNNSQSVASHCANRAVKSISLIFSIVTKMKSEDSVKMLSAVRVEDDEEFVIDNYVLAILLLELLINAKVFEIVIEKSKDLG